MRITFTREGGIAFFPGLNAPVTIDDAQLPPDQASELDKLMKASCFFEQPAQVGTPKRGAADYMQYTITADDGTQQHSVHLVEPIQDAPLHELVSFLVATTRDIPRQPQNDAPRAKSGTRTRRTSHS